MLSEETRPDSNKFDELGTTLFGSKSTVPVEVLRTEFGYPLKIFDSF
jgi:hypothetical protein